MRRTSQHHTRQGRSVPLQQQFLLVMHLYCIILLYLLWGQVSVSKDCMPEPYLDDMLQMLCLSQWMSVQKEWHSLTRPEKLEACQYLYTLALIHQVEDELVWFCLRVAFYQKEISSTSLQITSTPWSIWLYSKAVLTIRLSASVSAWWVIFPTALNSSETSVISDVLWCPFPRNSSWVVDVFFDGDTIMSADVTLLDLIDCSTTLVLSFWELYPSKTTTTKRFGKCFLMYSTYPCITSA